MANTYSNQPQYSLLTVLVETPPAVTEEYIKFDPSLYPSIIFPILQSDIVTPAALYYDGQPVIPSLDISYTQNTDISISNSTKTLVSPSIEKGLFERYLGTNIIISSYSVLDLMTIDIPLVALHEFLTYDRILITGINNIIPNGIYKILKITSDTLVHLTINYIPPASLPPYNPSSPGIINKFIYLWDEVYTTPIGRFNILDFNLYQGQINTAIDFPSAPDNGFYLITNNVIDNDPSKTCTLQSFVPGDLIHWIGNSWNIYQNVFYINNNNGNIFNIDIEDPNIVPSIGDYLSLQIVYGDNLNYVEESTTDGINNVNNTFGFLPI